TKFTGEKLRHFTDGIGTCCWLGADGSATAPAGFVPVAYLGANVYRIMRGIKAMVGIGIHFKTHRGAKCLGALGPVHARRRRGPVILGTDHRSIMRHVVARATPTRSASRSAQEAEF